MSRKHAQDWYYGQEEYEKYHELVKENLSGKEISKRIDTADQPGGIEYEAKQLGIDLFDLLKCLEGMCHNGEAEELYPGDSYKVAAKTAMPNDWHEEDGVWTRLFDGQQLATVAPLNLHADEDKFAWQVETPSSVVADGIATSIEDAKKECESVCRRNSLASRKQAGKVANVDDDIKSAVSDLFAEAYGAPGCEDVHKTRDYVKGHVENIIYDVALEFRNSHESSRKTAQAESVEYIAEQVVDFAKKNLNGWLDAGLDDVAIDDKLVDEINAYGVDDEKFGAVMDLVVGQLEADGLLTDSRYVYAKKAAYDNKELDEDLEAYAKATGANAEQVVNIIDFFAWLREQGKML